MSKGEHDKALRLFAQVTEAVSHQSAYFLTCVGLCTIAMRWGGVSLCPSLCCRRWEGEGVKSISPENHLPPRRASSRARGDEAVFGAVSTCNLCEPNRGELFPAAGVRQGEEDLVIFVFISVKPGSSFVLCCTCVKHQTDPLAISLARFPD